MMQTAVSVISLAAFSLALGSAAALTVKAAAVRVLEERVAQYETKAAESLADALASRDREIARLGARIDEQWREFYETLEARQPALKKGKGGISIADTGK